MALGTIFRRNLKWRIQNPITIIMSILQPMLWLIFYSKAAEMTMKGETGGNYIEFILPGILVLVIFSSSGSSGISNYITKKNGSFYIIKRYWLFRYSNSNCNLMYRNIYIIEEIITGFHF